MGRGSRRGHFPQPDRRELRGTRRRHGKRDGGTGEPSHPHRGEGCSRSGHRYGRGAQALCRAASGRDSVKLSVTEYEREQLATARQIVDELNANLAGRGAEFRFAVTLTTPQVRDET